MASQASKIQMLKQQHRAALANARRRQQTKGYENTLIRKGAILTTGGVFGALNRFGVDPDIGGFPWKVGVAGLAWIGEAMSSGSMQSVFGGIGDATLAIYVERAISNKTLVAGVESVGADEDDEEVVIEAEGGEL